MRAVRGKTAAERAVIRHQNTLERRRQFHRDLLEQAPEGSFERLRRALDFVRAVASDLEPHQIEAISKHLVLVALGKEISR
jgi:hypothetical protein